MFKEIKSKLNSYKEAFFEFYGDISNDGLYIVNTTNTYLYPQKTKIDLVNKHFAFDFRKRFIHVHSE